MSDATDPRIPGGRLNPDEVARFSEQVAGLSAAGLPLAPGLQAAALEMPPGRLRSTLREVASALESGATLDDVVGGSGRIPAHLRGLVRVGAKSGRLSEVLSRFVGFLGVGIELRRRLWISLAYPVMTLALAFFLFAFICSYVVGPFETLYSDFGVPLPGLTRVTLAFARTFGPNQLALVEAVVVFLAVLVGLYLIGPRTRRAIFGAVPVIGGVQRNTSLAEFCHLLALLLESRLPLGEALRLTGDGLDDARFDRACQALGAEVEQGTGLSQAILRQPVFPRGLARVLQWAESSQSLPGALHMAGDMFAARARSLASFVGTIVGIATVVLLIVSFGWLVVSLFLPLITLISKLSG